MPVGFTWLRSIGSKNGITVSFFAYNLSEPIVQILLEFCYPWIEQFSTILEESRCSELSPPHVEGEPLHSKQLFEASVHCGPFIWPILDSFLHLTNVVNASFMVEHQIGLLWELLGNQQHDLLAPVLCSFLELQFEQFPDLCRSIFLYLMRSNIGQTLGDAFCYQY
jgi:hypothetical protein